MTKAEKIEKLKMLANTNIQNISDLKFLAKCLLEEVYLAEDNISDNRKK